MNPALVGYWRVSALATIGLLLWATAGTALAQAPIIPEACRFEAITQNPGGCTICHMAVGTIRLTNFLMTSVALPLAALLFAAGGFMLLISGGSEQRWTLGKNILTSTLIGVIIVFVAWLGVDTIIKVLTGAAAGETGSLFRNLPLWFAPWNEVPISACKL